MLIDTHVHVISTDERAYPRRATAVSSWVAHAPRFDAARCLAVMDDAGVDRALLVQSSSTYGDDNRYVLDAAAAHPDRLRAVGIVDAEADARGALQRLAAAGAVGVRFVTPDGEVPTWLRDPVAAPLLAIAADLGLHVTVLARPDVLPLLRAALDAQPSVSVLLDHCALDGVAVGPPYPPMDWAVLALADVAQLYLKVSSVVLETSGGGHGAEVLGRLADAFGAERLVWGSDHPHTRHVPYPELLELARAAAASVLRPDEEAGYLGGNAARVWPHLAQ